MMKLKYFALSMAFLMAVALTGCSANRDKDSTASSSPAQSAASDYDDRASAGMGDGAYYSDNAGGTMDNGHASGDYGQNDVSGGGSRPSDGGGVMDDIGDAAGDLARGAGDVARGAGNAIGNAANDVGRAMR